MPNHGCHLQRLLASQLKQLALPPPADPPPQFLYHPQVLVSQLMDMKADAAELASRGYLDLWGFPGTYCLAKHLAEKLVAEYHARR